MNVKYKDKLPKQETEVSIGNLYDVNKQMMQNETPLTKEEITERIYQLVDWLQRVEAATPSKYYMLLCNERRDYTLFNLDKTGRQSVIPDTNYLSAAADVIDCMVNRGDLLAVDYQSNDNVWELWIRTFLDECCAYYLFPYGQAVLEY